MAAAFVIAIVSRHPSSDNAAAVARADVQGSRELVARAVARETEVDRQASLVEDSAHAALARAAAAVEGARRAENAATASRTRFDALARTAPAECDSVVAAAQSSLAASAVTVDSLKSANYQLVQGASGLQRALDSTRVASTAVKAAAVDLSGKAGVLVAASKPSFRSRLRALIPHPGIGVAGGVNAVGQPQVIVGATLGWSF
jgi:hypothetical protein